ncbi:MAG: hypothetical protein SAqTSB_33560 [Shewanella algae]
MTEDLLTNAIDNLPKELQAKLKASHTNQESGDTKLEFIFKGQAYAFHVECKLIHRKESLQHFLNQHNDITPLLVCNPLSDFLRDYCHEQNINYIDAAGNARIVDSGLYILLQGNKHAPRQAHAPKISIGIMKCLFALLVESDLLTRPYSEIAQKADISLGMVSKAIGYLIDNKHIPAKKSERRFLDKQTLIYQWLASYSTTLRPKLKMVQLNTQHSWEALKLQPGDIWGGEVAASTLTDYLVPEQWLLFTRYPIQQKIREYRARPAADGNLTVAAPFWGESLKINQFTTALLSTAELLASQDSRNREVAEIINDQYLHLKQLP